MPDRPEPRPAMAGGTAGPVLRAAALAFGPLALSAALTLVRARLAGLAWNEVVLLPPEPTGVGALVVGLAAWIAGVFASWLPPGLLLARAAGVRFRTPVAAALGAFAASLAAVAVAWSLARGLFPGAAGRSCLYLTVAVVDAAALALAAWRAPGAPALPLAAGVRARLGVELGRPALAIAAMLALLVLLMPGKIRVEALEGDATEVWGFASSLFAGPVPTWDLESGVWGFYPTFVFVAWPVHTSLAIAGGIEAAVRLPALAFLGILVLALADLAGRGRVRDAAGDPRVLVPFLLAGGVSLQVGAWWAGYHPFHADLGSSPLEQWLPAALAFAALVLARDGHPRLAGLAAFLAILTFPSGVPLVGLIGVTGLVLGPPEERSALLRTAATLAVLLGAWAAFVVGWGAAQGTLGPTLAEWWAKYFQGRGDVGAESGARMVRALGWWALLAGGLPALGPLVALGLGDRRARQLAAVTIGWVAVFVLSPNKNIHYFLPAALPPLAAGVRALVRDGAGRRTALASAALAASAGVALLLCRPPHPPPPYVADRELGHRTFFVAESVREAVEQARVLYNLGPPLHRLRPGGPWTIGRHTWVMYADRGPAPERDYDFYVGPGEPPVPGLREITRIGTPDGTVVRLWSRGGRADWRRWREATFPARHDLSRFHFEM